MTDSDEPLLGRLNRLRDKQERGEDLTDEEIEQLKADLEQFHEAIQGISDVMADVAESLQQDTAVNMQPLADFFVEYEMHEDLPDDEQEAIEDLADGQLSERDHDD